MFLRPNPLLHKELFYTKVVLSTNNTMFYSKNHVVAGPVQGLFAAYRIALSMVAGGTRRRRLIYVYGVYIVFIGDVSLLKFLVKHSHLKTVSHVNGHLKLQYLGPYLLEHVGTISPCHATVPLSFLCVCW